MLIASLRMNAIRRHASFVERWYTLPPPPAIDPKAAEGPRVDPKLSAKGPAGPDVRSQDYTLVLKQAQKVGWDEHLRSRAALGSCPRPSDAATAPSIVLYGSYSTVSQCASY